MQPYKRGSDAESDPVCIVHDMDRFDKHRELAIISSCASVNIPLSAGIEVAAAMAKYGQGKAVNDAELALIHKALNQNPIVLPQIAFMQVGKWKEQPVVPTLSQLHEAIFERIDLFEGLV
jgi:hypothetical protein